MSREETLCNLGLGQAALQSSYSPFSDINDPIRALSGNKTGSLSFHTDCELNPWWMADLGSTVQVKTILVYNRCDAAQNRTRHLSVQIYDMAIGVWKTVYLAENEFGGVTDGNPLRLEFGSRPKSTRFIKIEIQGVNSLHLDQVEIYGFVCQPAYRERMSLVRRAPRARDKADTEGHLPKGRGAIVALVRGYEDIGDYHSLIERNKAIFKHINANVEEQYPLLIFHEGNIPVSHQSYILSGGLNHHIRFIDVSQEFALPEGVDPSRFKESWRVGYRLMCKFNTADIWDLTRDFKYILRIDEDCIIEELPTDPFKWMEENDLDCGFSLLINDSHDLTNETLPSFVEAFLEMTGEISPSVLPLTSRFPYTNFMIANTSFFREDKVTHLLSCAVAEPSFYENRWGDHIVLGAALNLYSNSQRIQPIPGLRYRHESHSLVVTSNDSLRQADMNSHETLLPHNDGTMCDEIQRERELLKRYKLNPLDFKIRDSIIDISQKIGRIDLAVRLAAAQTLTRNMRTVMD